MVGLRPHRQLRGLAITEPFLSLCISTHPPSPGQGMLPAAAPRQAAPSSCLPTELPWHLWSFLGGRKGSLTASPLRGADGVQLRLRFPRRWSNAQESQVYIYDLLFIDLLNFPVPLCINHKPSNMGSRLLLLLRPACKMWSSEAAEGLSTDKCLPSAACSHLKSQRGLKICFYDLM